MSKSAGFPQKIADLLRQNCVPVQTVGGALAVGGFAGLWWLAPTNRAAQLSAALFGVAIILFTQFFFSLRKLKPEERRSLEAAGACCLILCLAGTVGAACFHWAAGRRAAGGAGAGGGATAPGGAAQNGVAFASEIPNRLVVQSPVKDPKHVVVEIEKVWVLTPDNAPPETLDFPLAEVELPAESSPHHQERAPAGSAQPIHVNLAPVLPGSSAESVLEGTTWVTRLKLTKPGPKDYVFLLRVDVITRQGKTVNAGSVVYFPDLKTKYDKLTPANQEALREIAAVEAPKSPKLAELLSKASPAPGAKK